MYMYQNNQEPSVPQSQNIEAYQRQAFMINNIYNKYSTLIRYMNENVKITEQNRKNDQVAYRIKVCIR